MEFVLAMTRGIPLSAFLSTIHPYPTRVEAIKRLGESVHACPLEALAAEVTSTSYFKVRR